MTTFEEVSTVHRAPRQRRTTRRFITAVTVAGALLATTASAAHADTYWVGTTQVATMPSSATCDRSTHVLTVGPLVTTMPQYPSGQWVSYRLRVLDYTGSTTGKLIYTSAWTPAKWVVSNFANGAIQPQPLQQTGVRLTAGRRYAAVLEFSFYTSTGWSTLPQPDAVTTYTNYWVYQGVLQRMDASFCWA